MSQTLQTDVVIIGAGTAGSYAMREVRKAKRNYLLVDHGPLGTVCARVGCMPSKVALHAGAQWQAATTVDAIGGHGASNLTLDRDQTWQFLRQQRDGFANPTASRIRQSAGEHLIMGRAQLLSSTKVLVELNDGGTVEIDTKAIVIANGSTSIVPKWLDSVRSRVITTDELFELKQLPESLGILGLGAIGLEMGLAMSRLGIQVTGADIASTIGGMQDPEVANRAIERFSQEFAIWLQTEPKLSLEEDGILMQASDGRQAKVDLLLAALGRRPNVDTLNLEQAGIELDARGIPVFNRHTMQVGQLPIFIAGDVNNDVPLMHEAGDEGQIAGFNAARMAADPAQAPLAFQRKTPIGIAFTDPDLISVGQNFAQLKSDDIVVGQAQAQGNGRSRVFGETAGLLHIYAN
ncbi:dihydrolipoyl dehydrogenase [Orrella sp. 11846]|uniref:dihydrolipoyl dehydrogenase n=1 Tax=Orrella sp. 11846 TaxID=3409913 RepID=UPI003B5BB16F